MSKQATKGSLSIGVRCQDKLVAEIDRWRRSQIIPVSRAAALRRFAEIGMERLRQVADQPQAA